MNNTQLRLLGVAAAATLALAGCATSGYGSTGAGVGASGYGASSARCMDCGTVTRIEQINTGSTAPRATGAVLGGLVGAAAGRAIASNQTDSEGRQNTATVGGAIAGAVAGNAIQNRTGGADYNVYVRMDDGRTTVVTQSDLAGIREGGYVRVYNGRAWVR